MTSQATPGQAFQPMVSFLERPRLLPSTFDFILYSNAFDTLDELNETMDEFIRQRTETHFIEGGQVVPCTYVVIRWLLAIST